MVCVPLAGPRRPRRSSSSQPWTGPFRVAASVGSASHGEAGAVQPVRLTCQSVDATPRAFAITTCLAHNLSQCWVLFAVLCILRSCQVVSCVNSSTCTSFELRDTAAQAEASGNLREVDASIVRDVPEASGVRARSTSGGATGNLLNASATRWSGDTEMLGSVLRHKSVLQGMVHDRDNGALADGE